MKKLGMILILMVSNQIFAMSAVCNEVSFEGNENGVASNFPSKIFIEKLSSEEIMISKSLGANGIIAEKNFENTYRDFIGYSNYRINYFGEKKRVGTLFLGHDSKLGEAFYTASSGCRGGYIGGCSSSGRKTYACSSL